jgi:hypothetical protein
MKLTVDLIVCLLATCVLVTSTRAQTNARTTKLTQPYTMREDFQGDSLGQFASYPPAQDVGYEPSLTPTSQFDAPGGRALMRVVKPNVPGVLRFGFIRKIRIVVRDDAALSFAYRVNTPSTGSQIEIGLAGTNGRLYTRKITAQTNRWTVADARLSELRDSRGAAPPSGLRVEAIYLLASLIEADPDTTYRFMIDDLSLKAEREAHFMVSTPATEAIDPWPVLVSDTGYRAADKIAFETTAPARLMRVNCTLKTPDGRSAITKKLYDDGTHGDRRSADGIWSNNDFYSVSAADQTGLWKAQLDGSPATGEAVSTVVRLIVHPATSATNGGHPRLFFNAADRQKLIERSRDPKLSSLWAHLQTTAKNTRATGELAHGGAVFELLDSEYLLPSLLAYFDVLNRARFRIAHNAFEAYVTDSAEARASAKSAMLDVANWKRWQPPWFNAHGQHTYYPAGILAADVALGYDLLYKDLTETERAQIRRALIEKSIIPTYKEYVVDNRIMANTSNWIAHTVGGALIAAASIAGDVQLSESPSESNPRFETYLHGLLLKLEDHMAASFLPDGSYGEGISYHEFDTETLAPALNALRRVFGIDYWKQTHVLDSLNYPLYTLAQPPSGSLDMGDTHPPAGHGIPALAYESKDPVVRWYYAQFDRPSLSKFIFYDDSVAPQAPQSAKPPKLPTSRVFRDKGNAVFRNGWDKDAIIFLYRAGPNFNHHHADQGSFLLNAFGENLVTEAGWSDYYKDPYYATFFTQAIGHSTVLVDGNPESQNIADTPQFAALNNYPRITDAVTSEFYDSVSSELASVYQNRLERFSRQIVFMKPHYFVIFDDLVAKGEPARFDWLLHLPDRLRIETQDKLAIYRGKQAALAVRAFAPGELDVRVREGRVPYPDFATRTPPAIPAQPAFLDLATKPVQATRFLVALVPARTSAEARARTGNMSEVKNEQWFGIRTRRSSEIDLVMFRTSGQRHAGRSQPLAHDKWLTDAVSWAVTEAGEQLVMLSAHNVRTVSRSGRQLFSSDQPASFAAHFGAERVQANVSATGATQIRLFTGAAPVKVQLDGRDTPPPAARYNRSDGMISLLVPAGQHELVFELR